MTGRACVADAFHLEVQDLGRGNCKHSFLSLMFLSQREKRDGGEQI